MTYQIELRELGFAGVCRVAVHDAKHKRFHRLEIVNDADRLLIGDKDISARPWDFVYKVQQREGTRWVDRTRYRPLAAQMPAQEHLLGSARLDSRELDGQVETLVREPSSVHRFKKVAYLTTDKLLRSKSIDRRVAAFSAAVLRHHSHNPFYPDLAHYWEAYLRVRRTLGTRVNELAIPALTGGKKNAPIVTALGETLDAVRAIKNRGPLVEVITGQLSSAVDGREKAAEHFEQAVNWPDGDLLVMDIGAHTYVEPASRVAVAIDNVSFLTPTPRRAGTTIVVGADLHFFRSYAAQWLHMIASVRTVPVHFHIVGPRPEVEEAVARALEMLRTIVAFRRDLEKPLAPTFSTEPLPAGTANAKTYYACARLVHGRDFLDAFGGPVYLVDADMYMTAHPGEMLARLEQGPWDVGLVLTRGLMALLPWRRVMGGNVYLSQSEASRRYIEAASAYVRTLLDVPQSWTLDQNALAYAYEATPALYVNALDQRVFTQSSAFSKHVESR